MIFPITHLADWKYIRQQKQTQKYNDVIWENAIRIDHDYRQGDKVMTRIKSAFKYKTLYRAPYKKIQTRTNGTVTLGTGAATTSINIQNIKSYHTPIVEEQYLV